MGNREQEGKAGSKWSAFSLPAIVSATLTVGIALLPLLQDASMSGVSQLLALTYLAIWIAILVRCLVHLRERYWQIGLKCPLLFEIATVLTMGTTAWLILFAENPQIPRLLVCATTGAACFFFGAGKMEEARAEKVADGVEVRRASDVIRAHKLWRLLCRRIGQIHFKPVKRVREFFAQPDTKDGNLSFMTATSVLVLVGVGLIATGLAIASVPFPLQLTPEGDHLERHRHRSEKQGEDLPTTPPEDISQKMTECGDISQAVREVPEPERSSLLLAWAGVDGIQPGPMEALGFEIAGCPGKPLPIPGLDGSWYQPGYCGEELASIVVAPEGFEHPIVLLEQAGEYALPMILKGEFAGATDRFSAGSGDAYIINSYVGSHVLIREHASAGPVEDEKSQRGRCAGYTDEDVEYTPVGPGMIETWRIAAAISPGGVYPIKYARETDGREHAVFRSPEGIVAEGVCDATMCTINIGEQKVDGRGSFITEGEVKALVES